MVTILTPAYNRAEGLKILFESLLKQTSNDFEWLIIDDGSTDNTKQVVDEFIQNKSIPIRYVYKENGGKHTALNVGINMIESELTFIVDSDDWLTSDAVETVNYYAEKYKSKSGICGFSFLRQFPNGKVNGMPFKSNAVISNHIKFRINSKDLNADKAEVFYTKCLKEFPFPEYDGEKFLGEDIIWIRMARKYNMIYINKAIYVGNYLEDGLTQNRRKHNIKSPVGCMNRALEFMKKDINFKYRIKGGLQYIIYGKFAGIKVSELLKNADEKLLTFICIPAGTILFYKWKKDNK